MKFRLFKLNRFGIEPIVPAEEGEEISLIDFEKIDPLLPHPHSILCLILQTTRDSVIENLKVYSPQCDSIPNYKIWYSPSSTWLPSLEYEDMILSSSLIPNEPPATSNLLQISGSTFLSGSSISGSSQYMYLMLELEEGYPFGIYEPETLNLVIDYDVIE